jgi:hypothetical protein
LAIWFAPTRFHITNEVNVRNLGTGNRFRHASLQICLTVVLALLLVPALAFGQAFVQVADGGSAPPQAVSVNVTFTNPQAAGDLNVVVAGWSDTTSAVTSVVDSNGNTYSVAAGTNAGSGVSQAIFYASNIKAGANTITVNFRTSAAFPDVRAIEYSGVSAATPLNVSAGGGGPVLPRLAALPRPTQAHRQAF